MLFWWNIEIDEKTWVQVSDLIFTSCITQTAAFVYLARTLPRKYSPALQTPKIGKYFDRGMKLLGKLLYALNPIFFTNEAGIRILNL